MTSFPLRAMPSVPGDPDVEDFDDRRTTSELLAESEALELVAQGGARDASMTALREAFKARKRLHPLPIEHLVIDCAMAKILGEDVSALLSIGPLPDEGRAWETFALKTVAAAWAEWSAGNLKEASRSLTRFRERQHAEEKVTTRQGAINLMSVYYWAAAVEALVKGERTEAKRLWDRALVLSRTHGTSSSLPLQWGHVASFG